MFADWIVTCQSDLGIVTRMTTTPTSTVLTEAEAGAYVAEWMAAWNSHDVERILEHYAEDVEYWSPFIAALAEPDGPGANGRLVGKDQVRAYFAAALAKYAELHFDPPWHIAAGAGSVSFVYRSVNDLTAVETLVFQPGTRIVARAHCHYSAGSGDR
jgi:ketosteroid isomerase-like protein